jgi:preprotein translocase subunit SecD
VLFLVALSVAALLPTVVGDDRLPTWFTGVFSQKVKLGLDLQGGLHLVYGIDLDRVVDDKASELKRDVEAVLDQRFPPAAKTGEKKAPFATVDTPRSDPAAGIPLGAIVVKPTNPADKAKLDASFWGEFEELIPFDCPAAYADAACVRVDTDAAERLRDSAIAQAIKTITERINSSGVAELTPQRKGDDIIVELPGADDEDNDRLRAIIRRTAKLDFKIVDDGTEYMKKLAAHVQGDEEAKRQGITAEADGWNADDGSSHSDYYLRAQDRLLYLTAEEATKKQCAIRGKTPVEGKYECNVSGRQVIEDYMARVAPDLRPSADHELGFEEERARTTSLTAPMEKSWRTFYLRRATELSGTAIENADKRPDPTTGQPTVLIKFNRDGARRFGDLTTRNVGRKMAIILDEKVNSAPVINGPITGGDCVIQLGRGDAKALNQEAEDLVNVLRAGSLPAPLVERQMSRVGALLGADAIDRAKLSMGVGAVLVILVMLWFYGLSGAIANVAMVLNVLFQVAILAGLQATLTLPGIAGLVLTIGMAVDSNIIIYARIRDELRAGKTVRAAVDAGFNRAFWTVFDAHVANFIAGFVLWNYGTGPIKGFAATLMIGVACNLFTSTWVSRLMFDHYVSRRKDPNAMISI